MELIQAIENLGLPAHDPAESPSSALRFPDGGQWRIEIPSTEGPQCLRAVVEEADRRQAPVHRVSQGSGILMLTDDEIREMVRIGRQRGIEVNLFIGPRATFDIGAQAYAAAGKSLGLSLRGADQLRFALLDAERALNLGIRSILVSDTGCLQAIARLRAQGVFPKELILKTSVMMAPANPASAKILEDLGADTINIPSDLTIPQIAAIRAVIKAPIDFYVEAPDNIGGFVRYYEIPELIRVAAPIYLKFGVRNSPDIYPSGTHLDAVAVNLSRERVRRAELALQVIRRLCPDAAMSPLAPAAAAEK
jgi:hypothetical protein